MLSVAAGDGSCCWHGACRRCGCPSGTGRAHNGSFFAGHFFWWLMEIRFGCTRRTVCCIAKARRLQVYSESPVAAMKPVRACRPSSGNSRCCREYGFNGFLLNGKRRITLRPPRLCGPCLFRGKERKFCTRGGEHRHIEDRQAPRRRNFGPGQRRAVGRGAEDRSRNNR